MKLTSQQRAQPYKMNKGGINADGGDLDDDRARPDGQMLQQEKDAIDQAIKERRDRDMDIETRKFTVDMLNLIFGKSEETDFFWDQHLVPECIKKFRIHEAMKYHAYQEGIDQLLSRKQVNLNALFYALYQLFGLRIDVFQDGGAGPSSQQQYYDVYSAKMEEYFIKFRKSERPFGDPELVWKKFELVPRSKSFGLRNIPYKELFERQKQFKNE